MPRRTNGFPRTWSFEDLLKHLGGIAPRRVRLKPAPGTATEKDLIEIEQRENRLYELVDGVLVGKIMAFEESTLAAWLIYLLQAYLQGNDLGIVAGADGAVRLLPGLVRIPDVSFVSWQQYRNRATPYKRIATLVPDLAVEVLSKGNTKKEMARKLKDYFLAGVKLVWFVDGARRTVQVFTAPDQSTTLTEEQTLDGGAVLPGFQLPLKQLFSRGAEPPAQQRQSAPNKGPSRKPGPKKA
jgi:Uma2 family endonuclease